MQLAGLWTHTMNSKESDDEIVLSNVYLFNTSLYELFSVKFDSSFGQHLNDPHFTGWEDMWKKLYKIILKELTIPDFPVFYPQDQITSQFHAVWIITQSHKFSLNV